METPVAARPPAPAPAPAPYVDLPILTPHPVRCGTPRKSRRAIWRAGVLIALHLAILAHVAHWKVTGSTLTPLEPSEAKQTLELGYVNAGFVLFVVTILATLVLGRFFCGWACHVVAYQDLCAWLLKKVGLRPRPVRSRLLVFVPLLAALDMFVAPTVFRWLEGRELPGFVWHLKTDAFWRTFPGPAVAALTLLVDGFLLVWLLGAKGFCTYGCPYGAVFGLADRLAPGKIRVTDACEGCGHCTATCTSRVRVHEEVARYGMVVDPGCMKCMDCVNVCPKDALYYGFGKPSLFAKREGPKRRKVYDFSWPEEIAMAAIFLGSLLFAFRGLYGRVPFLLAIGLAVLSAVAAIALVRLLLRPEFSLQHFRLRVNGAFTPAGIAAAGLLAGFLLFTAHSAFVRYHSREGEKLLARAGAHGPGVQADLLEASLGHLLSAERWGLFGDATVEHRLGAILRERGDLEGAEARLRRAISIDPRFGGPHLALAEMRMHRGDLDGAERVLDDLVSIDPAFALGRMRRAQVALQRGDRDRARTEAEAAVASEPNNAMARILLGDLWWMRGDRARARAEFEAALARNPGNALARARLEALEVEAPR